MTDTTLSRDEVILALQVEVDGRTRAAVRRAVIALYAENDALKAKLIEVAERSEGLATRAADHIDALKAENERLRDALQSFPSEPNPYTYRIVRAKARAALATEQGNTND